MYFNFIFTDVSTKFIICRHYASCTNVPSPFAGVNSSARHNRPLGRGGQSGFGDKFIFAAAAAACTEQEPRGTSGKWDSSAPSRLSPESCERSSSTGRLLILFSCKWFLACLWGICGSAGISWWSVLQIRDILVRIRMRIRILWSLSVYESGTLVKSHKEVTKQKKSRFFLTIFAWLWKDPELDPEPDPYLWQTDLDADPGGPKTYESYLSGSGCGSRSPTQLMVIRIF